MRSERGDVLCWGYDDGRRRVGSAKSRSAPCGRGRWTSECEDSSGAHALLGRRFSSISAGGGITCGIIAESDSATPGTPECWGSNITGVLATPRYGLSAMLMQ